MTNIHDAVGTAAANSSTLEERAKHDVQRMLSRMGDLREVQEHWEQELEIMGAAASLDDLCDHLRDAPDPESATAQFLMGYLISQTTGKRR